MTEAHESITEAIEYGHKIRANTTVYLPRPGLAERLRRQGNEVVEQGDFLTVNPTGGPDAVRRY